MSKFFSSGTIEIICGPMFSGKSDELLKKVMYLKYASIKTLIIKPKFDNRFSEDEIVSRSGAKHKAFNASNAEEIQHFLSKQKYQALVIDEAHFFKSDVFDLVVKKADQGMYIIIAGLDSDFQRRPFGIMPKLIAVAEKVQKLQAICLQCKKFASFTYRKIADHKLNLLGDVDTYEARCRKCWQKNN